MFSPDAWTDRTGVTEPEHAAAMARLAKDGPRYRITRPQDIANHSVGVTAYDPVLKKDINFILLRKDTPVNTPSKAETFHTFEDGQKAVDIVINKGETDDLADSEQLGSVRIIGLPGGPAGEEVTVWLQYNGDGLITGEALHVMTQTKMDIKVSLNQKREKV
jgi:molecular chaperone DnaK (HSP70)